MSGSLLYGTFRSSFPTIPIWSNRWTGEEYDTQFWIKVRWFPTIPIWSNRWTAPQDCDRRWLPFWGFQLFQFEVIGEPTRKNLKRMGGFFCFQLFRFEVIGEPYSTSQSDGNSNLTSFQLFRFEVIGERDITANEGFILIGVFPTIPIWSNRWTAATAEAMSFASNDAVSNYSDLR